MNGLRATLQLILLAALLCTSTPADAQKLLIFAPSSMSDVMGSLVKDFNRETEASALLSIAGTPQLARQLDAGAPADIFVSADRDWMDWAVSRDLIEPENIFQLAGNSLVVAVRKEVENWADIDGLLTSTRFAMAEPNSVPAGRYAQQALSNKGLWEKAKPFAEFGDNVRITTRRLARGEVAAAIVYETDVLVEPGIKTIFTFSEKAHDPIIYWAAKVRRTAHPDTPKFIQYLSSNQARQLLTEAGFAPPPQSGEAGSAQKQ